MGDYRDPAIRLYNLLNAGIKISDSTKVEVAWRKILDLEALCVKLS